MGNEFNNENVTLRKFNGNEKNKVNKLKYQRENLMPLIQLYCCVLQPKLCSYAEY